jgi:predicted RecA/RadA family phage recombinase
MKNYIQKGEVINYTVPADTTIASGALVIVGDLPGVAVSSGVTGDVIAVSLEGVYELPKASGAINQGVKVYWSAANSNVTTTATSNTLIGYAFEAAASGDTTAMVRLIG